MTIFLFHIKAAIVNGLGTFDKKSQIIKRAGDRMWEMMRQLVVDFH